MKTKEQLGARLPRKEITPFPAKEGECNMYYGKIGSGKTYSATADIWEDLYNGKVVYATWPIKTEYTDDRGDLPFIIRGLFFWWKDRYFQLPNPENLHFINAETGEVDGIKCFDADNDKDYVEYLNKLNHCVLYIDEAWRVMDSYKGTMMAVPTRNLILVTRHKYRTVNLIAQRPTSVHVVARGNINRFFKCEKLFMIPIIQIPVFRRTEYQDMVMETVDETSEPESVKTYIGSRKIFNSYNSYYYGELKPLHELIYNEFKLSYKERIYALYLYLYSLLGVHFVLNKIKTSVRRIGNPIRRWSLPPTVKSTLARFFGSVQALLSVTKKTPIVTVDKMGISTLLKDKKNRKKKTDI